jgi:hypothetical protein
MAGDKFTVVSKATVAPASNSVFISVTPLNVERKCGPSVSVTDDPADGGIAARRGSGD